MTDVYETGGGDVYEEETYVPPTAPLRPEVSKEVGGKLSLATMQEQTDFVAEELMVEGRGQTTDDAIREVKKTSEISKLQAAGHIAAEEGVEAAKGVFLASKQEDDLIDLVNDSSVASMGVLADTPEEVEAFQNSLDRETALLRALKAEYRDTAQWEGSVVGNVAEFFESMLPFLNQKNALTIDSFIEEEFGVDLGDVGKGEAALLSGSYFTALRQHINTLDTEDQIDWLRAINEKAKESSGLLGGNDALRLQMLDSLFREAAGDAAASDWDMSKHLDNGVALLDVLMVGSVVKGIARVFQGISKASTAATTARVNPKAGGKVISDAINDPSGSKAAAVGTTHAEAANETLIAKVRAQADIPHTSSTFHEVQEDTIRTILAKDQDISLMLKPAERQAQAKAVEGELKAAKGGALWKNGSSVEPTTQGVNVKALYGVSETKGFSSLEKAQDFVENIKLIRSDANVKVVGKSVDGRKVDLRPVPKGSPITPRGSRKVKPDLGELKAKLTSEAGEQLTRGQEKALRRELKYYKSRVANLSPTKVVKGAPKKGVSARAAKRAAQQEAAAIDTAEAQTLTDLINRVERELARHNRAKLAERHLEQIRQGHVPEEHLEEVFDTTSPLQFRGTEAGVSSTPTEYFVEATFQDAYRAGSNVEFDVEDIIGRGAKAKFLGDSSSNFTRNISDAFHVAFDRSRGTEKLMLDILKPFTHAKNRNKRAILSLVGKGDKEEKVFSANEILDTFTDVSEKDMQEIMEGYYSIRNFSDVAYEIHNRTLTRHLDEKDLTSAVFLDDKPHFVKTLSREQAPSQAYNPITGEVQEFTSQQMKELYDSGAQVVKTEKALGTGNVRSTHIIVDNVSTTLQPRPAQVLNYREGYVPRMYKEQYFVIKRPKNAVKIDGETFEGLRAPSSTLTVAKSRKEAEALIEELQGQFPEETVTWKNDRALTISDRISTELDYERNTNGLYFGKRGEHIKDAAGDLAEIEDPVAAIHRQAQNISRHLELEPMTDLMKRRWVNSFGEHTAGKFPRSRDAIRHGEKLRDEAVDKAIAAWDQIDLLESGGVATREWRTSMVRFGEWVEEVTGSEKLGSFFRTKVSERDPFSVARGSAFTTMIILNPVRQMFIQTQQVLFLSGLDPKFVLSGQAMRQGSMLSIAATQKTPNYARLAKAAGMSTEEFTEAAQSFKRSGLIESIDSHLVGRDALKDVQNELTTGAAQRALQLGRQAAGGALTLSKRVGFDFGEQLNLGATYALARRRYARKGLPMNTPEAAYAIQADARQLALGMTSAGSFGYQKGVFSMATQFLSVQHKAFLAMLPAISGRGNKAITKTEARRILLFQAGLYGASGIGLSAIVDKALEEFGVRELPKEARHALEGGMYDLVMNGVLSAASGEDVDLAFAKNIAAGQGFAESLVTYAKDIMQGDVGIMEVMAGPSYNVGSKIGDVFRMTKVVLGSPEDIGAEEAELLLSKTAQLASGYNNYLKFSAMKNMPNSRLWVDSKLNAIPVEVSNTESILAGMLGISGYKQQAFYEMVKSRKSVRDDLDSIAKTYFDKVTFHVAKANEPSEFRSLDHSLRLVNEEAVFVKSALSPADYEYVMQAVQKLINQRVSDGSFDLAEQISRAAMNNSYGTEITTIVEGMQRDGLISSEQAQQLLRFQELMHEENNGSVTE